MKNKWCLLMRPLMLKAKSSENFLSPDPKVPNFGGFRGLMVRLHENCLGGVPIVSFPIASQYEPTI